MFNYLPMKIFLLLSFLSFHCFCLVYSSNPTISDSCPYRQRDFRLLAKAINDALNFFKDHVDELVLDAAVGTRILEGQINVILKAKPKNLPQHVHNFLIKTLLKSTGLSERIIRNVQSDFTITEEHKNGTLHWVKNPEIWEMPPINSWKFIKEETREYNLSKVYKDPTSTIPFGPEVLDEELSDLCIGQLFKGCNVSKSCEEVFLKTPHSMYSLTHQILFMLFVRKLNCTGTIEFQRKFPGNWKDFDELLCSRAYDEASLIAEHGFPDKHQDLFAEQVAVCSLLGFKDFLHVDWMYENIFWEKSLTAISGCFTNYASDFHRSSFNTTETEDENTANSTISETLPKRMKRSDVFIGLKGEDDEHCSVHFTANEELLKEKLTPFREACALLLDVFIWKNDAYPLLLGGLITFFFGTLWYLEPSVLTTIAFVGLCITLTDFFLPIVSKAIGTGTVEEWSPEKERKFAVFVNRITYYSVQVWNFNVTVNDWKKEKPNIYTSCVVILLLFLAWIGNAVNNLFLAYLLALFFVLLPGLLHRRILQVYLSKATLTIVQLLGIKSKKTN